VRILDATGASGRPVVSPPAHEPPWWSRLHVRLIVAIGVPLVLFEGARMLISYREDRAEAEAKIRAYLVEVTRQRAEVLTSRLTDVMQATRSAAWFLSTMELGTERATMQKVLSGVVEQSPLIYGSAVAFPPESLRAAFYVHRSGGGLRRIDYADSSIDYSRQEWFLRSTRQETPYWSAPYFDAGIGDTRMVTYSVPWHASAGPSAVLTADVALDALDIGWTSPWGGSSRVVDPHGVYLAHSGDVAPSMEGVLAAARELGLDELDRAGRSMIQGESGVRYVRDPDDATGMFWISYAPIGATGWSLMALIDEDRVLAKARAELLHQLALSVGALLLALVTLAGATKRLTRPLDALRRVAGAIGRGDHSERAGVPSAGGEIGEFASMFDRMLDALEATQAERLEEARRRQRIEGELSAARDMQRRLLPPSWPEWSRRAGHTPGFTFHGVCQPATLVSGDYYDVYMLDGDTVALVVADVCDKGIAAALYMAMVRTHLRAFGEAGGSPARTLGEVNRALASEAYDGMFVTVLLAHYHLREGVIDFACAGHPPPLIARAGGDVESLTARGELLGAFDGVEYTDARASLGEGDTLVLYSDGVTEAGEGAGSLYGAARLRAVLASSAEQPLDVLCAEILGDVLAHCDGEPDDDITLLAVRRAARP
jgi:sigma-B regulation protein RsbU (phosphoserine phosphatase)